MRTLLNIIWFVFGGLWLALGYALAGVVFCILILTIPLGVASFRMAHYALWPFGRAVVPKEGAGAGAVVLNVVWIVLAGWWLALIHVVTAVVQAITIIGIPLADRQPEDGADLAGALRQADRAHRLAPARPAPGALALSAAVATAQSRWCSGASRTASRTTRIATSEP